MLVVWSVLAAPEVLAQPGFPASAAAPAQGVASDPPRTYGIAAEVAHVVGAWEFEASNGTPAVVSVFGERSCAGADCGLHASLRLPSGALVGRLELDARDSDGAAQIEFAMHRTASPATVASVTSLRFGQTGNTATPGCAIFTSLPAAPVTIDNTNFNHVLRVGIHAADPALNFSAVRVYYTLQVSPAPSTATFGDVPTSHPFFQFIEALRASGITVGCTATTYCPDAPLTRGQMAVFLSKGLGLHFAP